LSFSREWEERYTQQQHLSIWPWTDLVSLVMRYCRPTRPDCKVLEVGCGAGANIPFFKWLDVEYFGVDGSGEIISRLVREFPELSPRLVVADFTKALPFDDSFDLIVDRASLTHNSTTNIRQALELILERLKPGGHFVGVDWFSTRHSEFSMPTKAVDDYTRRGFTEGQFAGLGNVHFSDYEHLNDLLQAFEIIVLDHKLIERVKPEASHSLATWNFVARKR
jgi:SAM-dependent methyltransferase